MLKPKYYSLTYKAFKVPLTYSVKKKKSIQNLISKNYSIKEILIF